MKDEARAVEATVAARAAAIGLCGLVTVLAVVAMEWERPAEAVERLTFGWMPLGHAGMHSLVLLAFGLALTMPTRRASGLRVGNLRDHWLGVLIVCGLPVLATAIVYPRLANRPFAGADLEMWALSPLAQDLVFMGFLYGRLEPLFPRFVHPRVPIRRALLVGAAFFAAWHLPNFGAISASYVVFQLAYTATGYVLTGLSRQWTGSLLYATLSHSAVNYIAWAAR